MVSDPRKTVMTVSLLTSLLMMAGKLTAYFLTNSSVILADAAESTVHGLATGFAAFSLWYGARPADANHPYGHGRITYISIGFEGMLVFAAAVAVMYSGVTGLLHGPQLRHLAPGMAIAAALAAINLTLGWALLRIGRRHRSNVVIANGKHVLTDVWTTAAAIIGLGLVMLTGIQWLDPIAALLIGGYILVSGASLVRKSVAGLMDELDPVLSARIIEQLKAATRDGVIHGYHKLRCRQLDNDIWVDVHLQVDGDLRMIEAHERATQVEAAILAIFPLEQVLITTHLEPDDHEATHPDGHEDVGDPLGADAPSARF